MLMVGVWNTIIYDPLYNAFIFLVNALPGHNLALAIIILTAFVKFVLLPLSHKSITTQAALKKLEPEIQKIKSTVKDKQEQARQTMELYKKHGVNPFSGCLPLLIQLPIILGLYWVFWRGLESEVGNLYSFVSLPLDIDVRFLWMDITEKSIVLGVLAGLTQYIQTKLSMPVVEPKESATGERSMKEDFARSMQIQMRYVLPIFVGFIAYAISAAVALYWTVSNLVTITHEIYVKRKKG